MQGERGRELERGSRPGALEGAGSQLQGWGEGIQMGQSGRNLSETRQLYPVGRELEGERKGVWKEGET